MTASARGTARIRTRYALVAAVALAVATVFATIGDGVEVPEATGLRRVVIDAGHVGVWALLAIAFAIAAARARWGRLSNGIAVAAGILYLVFLVAVFVAR